MRITASGLAPARRKLQSYAEQGVDISGKEIPPGAKIYISNVSGAFAGQYKI